jgi:hypothetical protein
LKCQDKREKRQPPLAEDRQAPVAAFPKTNVQTKVSRSLTVGKFANASSLYLAVLIGRLVSLISAILASFLVYDKSL